MLTTTVKYNSETALNKAPHIGFLTVSTIPGVSANSIQVMKMAQALTAIDPNLFMTSVEDLSVQPSFDKKDYPRFLRKLYGVKNLPGKMRFYRSGRRIGFLIYALRAALAAKRDGVDLVLTRSIVIATFTTCMGIKTVLEAHAPPQGRERIFWEILVRSPSFLRLVLISSALRKIYLNHYPTLIDIDILVAHDGVDLDRFKNLPSAAAAKLEADRDPNRLIAGYAGHLYAGRGIDVIIACAKALPHWDFVIAGGNKADIEELEVKANIKDLDNIELWGFVENSTLAERLAVADVLLMPYQKSVQISSGNVDTVGWMSPLKMFEYMAMGRAIISSDIPVLHEVLNKENAILVESGNTSMWVAALRKLERAEARQPLTEAATRSIGQYDWHKRVEAITRNIPGIET